LARMRNDFGPDYFGTAYGNRYPERNPPAKLAYYLQAAKEFRPTGTLLDIGCAYGSFLAVAREHYDASGCDISGHAVETAKSLLPSLHIYQSELESIPAEPVYDVVTCFDVLEHVRDIDQAFGKIRDLLHEEGVLVMTVPVYDTLAGLAVRWLDRDSTHVWKKGREFWREKLKSHGFRILKDVGLWRYFLLDRHYLFFGGAIWRNFSPAILLVGQRDDPHRPAGL
jgi:SAM-dependent methyltransferase